MPSYTPAALAAQVIVACPRASRAGYAFAGGGLYRAPRGAPMHRLTLDPTKAAA